VADAKKIVLVGGGHSHLEVLCAWAGGRRPRAELTLLSDEPRAFYSGMVPGLVSGAYAESELAIDLAALAARAQARFVCARALRIDGSRREIELAGGARLPYDLASLDIGAQPAGLELPGVAQHAIATRPISRLAHRLDAALSSRSGESIHCVVVGAGAAGVELACALERRGGVAARVTLLDAAPALLPGHGALAARLAARCLAQRGIATRLATRVLGAGPERLELEHAAPLAFDLLVWAAGAAAPPLWRDSGLATDARGYLRVSATLEACAGGDLFAAGDAASIEGHASAAKSGVHAVRAGPVLAHNLAARLEDAPLRRFRPQRSTLALLDLADGTALGTKWGLALRGRALLRWKRSIDRGWVTRIRGGGGSTGRTRG
jgi:selenide,water dikinase